MCLRSCFDVESVLNKVSFSDLTNGNPVWKLAKIDNFIALIFFQCWLDATDITIIESSS